MNGLTLLALIVVAIGFVVAYRAGVVRGQRDRPASAPPLSRPAVSIGPTPASSPPAEEQPQPTPALEADVSTLRHDLRTCEAAVYQLQAFAEDRRQLFAALADARAETARYRQIVVDLENNAPPPLLDGPGSPDDLKLIVGVGPVLERMLQQLGIGTYRQIARWTERDIDEFDAKLHEFPGRIRRDGWVTQARELHHSKYGEVLPARDRG